jgi:hypothetical protein
MSQFIPCSHPDLKDHVSNLSDPLCETSVSISARSACLECIKKYSHVITKLLDVDLPTRNIRYRLAFQNVYTGPVFRSILRSNAPTRMKFKCLKWCILQGWRNQEYVDAILCHDWNLKQLKWVLDRRFFPRDMIFYLSHYCLKGQWERIDLIVDYLSLDMESQIRYIQEFLDQRHILTQTFNGCRDIAELVMSHIDFL